MKIKVNGQEHEWSDPEISHEQICELAGEPDHASVTYYVALGEDIHRDGITYRGKTIKVDDAMIIDAVVTGSA